MTDNHLFFDSNIWLGYFLQSNEKIAPLVESPESQIFTSILSFHEVVKVIHREKRSAAFIKEVVRFMHENSTIVMVDEYIAVDAVEWCLKNKLSAVDSMIYQSARKSNCSLITTDSDFDGLEKVWKVVV
mgnify:CR=1 FL=1